MKSTKEVIITEKSTAKELTVVVAGKRIKSLYIKAYGQELKLENMSQGMDEDKAGSTLRFLAEQVPEALKMAEAAAKGE